MIHIPDDNGAEATLLPDLTPLLDVIFIVMVFLMFTANVAPLALPVDLPKQGASQAEVLEETKTITVTLLPGGQGWAVNGRILNSWDKVQDELMNAREEDPDLVLVIAGDRNVSMEKLVQLLSFLQSRNWPAASLMMEKEF